MNNKEEHFSDKVRFTDIYNVYVVHDEENDKYRAIVEDCRRGRAEYIMFERNEIDCVLESAKRLTQLLIDNTVKEAVEDERVLNR